MGFLEEARENHVKKKVEEALRSKMKAKALKECDELCSKYAECARGRTLSVVWTCRKQAKELNNCLHQLYGLSQRIWFHLIGSTNDAILEDMKNAYMAEQESKAKNQ